MQIFDTHAHVGCTFDDPIEQFRVIQEAKMARVTRIISICNSLHDFARVYNNLKTNTSIYHAVGVSPSSVNKPGNDWIKTLEEALKLPRVVALGETGLDYLKQYGTKTAQIELFVTQLEIAKKHDMPVIIHNRDAGKDIFNILKDRISNAGAVFHCYSENASYAKKALDLNVYFSFAGTLTYRNAHNLHETVMSLPLDRLLVESEAPFILPNGLRHIRTDGRSMPADITSTVKFLAEMLEMDIEALADQLWKNSCRFFRLPE